MNPKYPAFLMSLCFLLFLSGCATDSAATGDSEYLTGFYPSYLWVNQIETSDESAVSGSKTLHKVISDDFDLYHSDSHSEKSGGDIYCARSQWDCAHDFYTDGANYYFQAGVEYYSDEDAPITVDVDFQKFDVLASNGSFDNLHWQRDYAHKPETLILNDCEMHHGIPCTLHAATKDNRFESLRLKLFIYEDVLYYFIGMEADPDSGDKYYYFPVPESINAYFTAILKTAVAPE